MPTGHQEALLPTAAVAHSGPAEGRPVSGLPLTLRCRPAPPSAVPACLALFSHLKSTCKEWEVTSSKASAASRGLGSPARGSRESCPARSGRGRPCTGTGSRVPSTALLPAGVTGASRPRRLLLGPGQLHLSLLSSAQGEPSTFHVRFQLQSRRPPSSAQEMVSQRQTLAWGLPDVTHGTKCPSIPLW